MTMPSSSHNPKTEVAWSTGLYDCFSDMGTCCMACWCPCVIFSKIADIVDKGQTSSVASGAMYTVLACLIGPCLYSNAYRSKIRKEYNLKGSTCGDCWIHCCCEPCALSQEYRELQNQGFDMNLGWKENMEKQNRHVAMPPVMQGGMQR